MGRKLQHCPNCDGEVILWDNDLEADKCVDCGEAFTLDQGEEGPEYESALTYWTCSACGASVDSALSFCDECETGRPTSQYDFDSRPTGMDEPVPPLLEALQASQQRVKELEKVVEAAKLLDERWLLVYQGTPHPDGVQNIRLEFWRLVEALDSPRSCG